MKQHRLEEENGGRQGGADLVCGLAMASLPGKMGGSLVRGGAVWQLVGLITRRSQVQILPPLPLNPWSIPDTWVTVYTGHIGNTLASKGFSALVTLPHSWVEEPQVVVHKAHQPDFVRHLSNADVLTGSAGGGISGGYPGGAGGIGGAGTGTGGAGVCCGGGGGAGGGVMEAGGGGGGAGGGVMEAGGGGTGPAGAVFTVGTNGGAEGANGGDGSIVITLNP